LLREVTDAHWDADLVLAPGVKRSSGKWMPESFGYSARAVFMKKPLCVVVALLLSGPVYAGGNKRHTVTFDELLGMPVITIHTSAGKKRFVLDTGCAISSMDISSDKGLNLSRTFAAENYFE